MRKFTKLAALILLAGLSFSCEKPEDPEPEPQWNENTGEITYKMEPSASFTAEGGDKSFRFYCTESWHIECEADWLSFDPSSGTGTGEKTSYKVTVTAQENTERGSREAEVSIVSGESRYSFTATQKAPTITLTDEEIAAKGIEINRVYTGIAGSLTKLRKSDSEFYLGRARTSEHFIVLWDKGYDETGEIGPNDGRTPSGIRVDIDDLLKKAEIYYDTYVTKFGMRGPEGESFLDKYYMTICLYGTTSWRAEGGGAGDMGGLWVSATACQPTGSTIAHEIGHAFQYQVYADYGQKNAGFMQIGGLFWEACGNWQSYNLYAEQAFNSENFRVFTENHMRHFHHEHQRYATYWFQFLWTDKYGWPAYGKLWKESKRSEDACQAYMRIFCEGDIMKFNRDLWEYAARCATWDFSSVVVNLDESGNVAREAPIRDFGEAYIGKLGWVSEDDGGGWQRVAYVRAPEATGFNIIRLKVPEAGSVTTEFEGLPGASGYNKFTADKADAGWYLGYVALKADGTRVYSEPVFVGAELKGSASWNVPEGAEKLWLAVACTPTKYYGHSWDEDDTNDVQWPYRIRLSGCKLYGTLEFDGTETPHDVEIVKDVDVAAADGYAGPAVAFDDDDFEAIGMAFVKQPAEIASMIAADRANYKSGKVWFGALQTDGTISYNYTANGYGFWFDPEGNVTPWGGSPTVYTEYSPASWTFQLGTHPGSVSPGETYTIRPVFVYGNYKAVVTIRLHIK